VLETPAFDHPFVHHSKPSVLNLWITKYLPNTNTPILGAFTRLMSRMSPVAPVLAAQFKLVEQELDAALQSEHNDLSDKPSTGVPLYRFLIDRIHEQILRPGLSQETVDQLQNLLQRRRLLGEGINMRFAGTDTVANAVLVGIRYLLTHRIVLDQLIRELDDAWPDGSDGEISYETLEKLPFLTAVIKESLRLSHGVVTPAGRVVRSENAVILGESIPSGTTVAMSSTFIHLNADLFPNPKQFNPARWLRSTSGVDMPDQNKPQLEVNSERFLVSFSRGPRSCVGIHLAYCELFIIFGYLFRKLELTIASTDQDPDLPLHFDDFFLPVYKEEPLCAVFVKERVFY